MSWRDRRSRRTSHHDDDSARAVEQALADLTQTHSDADQSASDQDADASTRDRTTSLADDAGARADQSASDADQAAADLEARDGSPASAAQRHEYDASREARSSTSRDRAQRSDARARDDLERAQTQASRYETAILRDEVAAERDAAAELRDSAARRADQALLAAHPRNDELRLAVALHSHVLDDGRANRLRAAADRSRAAEDRIQAAAAERHARMEVQRAQLDGDAGVFGSQLGRTTLRSEIDRCRRGQDAFVLVHLAIEGLPQVGHDLENERSRHVVSLVVAALQRTLRSYDPVVRIEFDEFLCGLPGTSLDAARLRFDDIRAALERTIPPAVVSVGFAALAPEESLEALTQRATADLQTRRAGPSI